MACLHLFLLSKLLLIMILLFLMLGAYGTTPYLSLDGNFYLGWEFGESDITFTFNVMFIQCTNILGYCAIAFDQDMHGTEIMVVKSTNGVVEAVDYYSTSQVIPTQIIQGTLTLISSTVTSTGISGTFSRSQSAGSTQDHAITVGLNCTLGYAYLTKANSFTHHDTKGYGTITFGATNETSSFISIPGTSDFFKTHGTYMTISWVCLAQLAIFVMRYFKWWSLASVVHGVLGTATLVFTLDYAYQAYQKNETPLSGLQAETDLMYHSRLGMTLCAMCMAQFTLGVVSKYFMMYKTKLRIVMLVRRLHQILGWAMPLMSFVNIRYGWKLNSDTSTLNNIVYPFYAVLAIIIAVLEVRHRWGNRINYMLVKWRTRKLDNFQGALTKSVSQGMDSLLIQTEGKRHIEILNEIREKKRKWVFYDENILDVSGFRLNHPGGTVIFDEIYGQDAGKYINGSSSVNDEISPYTHSRIAKNMINFLKIGKCAYTIGVLINRTPDEKQSSMDWTLSSSTSVSSTVYCLEFSSDAWDVSRDPPGYEWMGKHFLVSATVNKERVNRYYSLILVNLAVWADEVRKSGKVASNYNISKNESNLRLYVKKYEKGKLSPHVCGLNIGDQLHFKGPLGPGLCLQSLIEEDYIAFGAGTGILPFLDLVYSIWQQHATKIKLHLYVTFKFRKESFAIDLLEATAERFPKNLKLYLRIEESLPQMDQNILNNWVVLSKVHKVWICGPPGFNNRFRKLMLSQNYSDDKIILL